MSKVIETLHNIFIRKEIKKPFFRFTDSIGEVIGSKHFKRCQLSAEQGDADAQYNLGIMYELSGTDENREEAAKWFRLAAEQGHSSAQFILGRMCRSGEGVFQSDQEAVKWWRKAAKQGDHLAQFNLGHMYSVGTGVAQNDSKAFKWYRLAAEDESAYSLINLGKIYEAGIGVNPNSREAFKCFRLAAKQGISEAHYHLGRMHESGGNAIGGVQRSYSKAYKWYLVSAAQGYIPAAQARDGVCNLLSPQELEEAQAEATKCIESDFKDCD